MKTLRVLQCLGLVILVQICLAVKSTKQSRSCLFSDPQSCRVRKDLYQGCDHLPIHSILIFVLQLCQFEPCPLWKKADEEAIKEEAKQISSFLRNITCISDIDLSVNNLISWMKEVIDKHVHVSKLAPFRIP